ncbi:HAD-IIIA family hydrolase [Phormidium sp. CCY1219]|uniref:HAD-IIIA family hydrolase n=1 Tax=Phormidium sp. CCY1219 TaxID=2886104 RepID=UPI002D1E9BDB|nr:HAD-IIIA family hydrolase [Phormidium sp. CCY1219]MEB3831892.1 HAD-IIIA family hydrolase [Phormidium sp. CCY1219]
MMQLQTLYLVNGGDWGWVVGSVQFLVNNIRSKSMTGLIIFDKDQTLIDSACGEKFIQSPTDQRILPGAAEAVSNFAKRGYKIAIASNQGGVEAGKKSFESAIEEMKFCLGLFPEISIGLICPCYDGKSAWMVKLNDWEVYLRQKIGVGSGTTNFGNFRKPGPGMINFLIAYYKSVPGETWFIGDRPEDEQAAEAAGTNFMAADILRLRFQQSDNC